MNENQQKVYDWLTFTASVEATGIGMQVYSIKNNAPLLIIRTWEKLTDLEQDEVIQKAILELDGEKVF
jgi:hypothetical protein